MAEAWELPRTGTLERPLRVGILISGSGSGMEALVKYQLENECKHTTTVVISDRAEVGGLAKAENLGISSVVVPLPEISDSVERRRAHEIEVESVLSDFGVELIVLSGYMRILTPEFVKPWAGRLLNIHPSLLPKFPGAHAHRDVIAAGEIKSGCTVHFVDSGMDTGPIIAQESLEVYPEDDENSLSERVKKLEHALYPKVIDMISEGLIQSP